MPLFKVVSGGQAGVDRAALDAAMELGIEVGGWCPRGRWAEDGPIADRYPLSETRSSDVQVRTQRNVETSSATLVLTRGAPIGGTRYTVEIAESMRRPLFVIDLNDRLGDHASAIARFIDEVQPAVLNVAGPRESSAPGVAEQAKRLLVEAFGRSRHARPETMEPMKLNAAFAAPEKPAPALNA